MRVTRLLTLARTLAALMGCVPLYTACANSPTGPSEAAGHRQHHARHEYSLGADALQRG